MPAWYHIEGTDTTRMYKGRYSECLRKNHGVQTVGDLETEAQKIRTARHSRRWNCRCVECVADRARRCNSPFKCYTRANEILRTLPPKWNPATEQPEELSGELDGHQEDGATFDNRITVEGTLADVFRIFTEGTTTNVLPDIQQGHDKVAEESIVYTDGSCINNGNEDARAGAGIFCPSNEDLNWAIRLPEGIPQTNQSGEILSIMEAAKTVQINSNLRIFSDSKTSIEGLTKHRQKWEDAGFIGVANPREYKATIATLRNRKAKT
ncbi:hypothetical protein C8R42DRAFT_632817, partial [Lentinula raphanica]